MGGRVSSTVKLTRRPSAAETRVVDGGRLSLEVVEEELDDFEAGNWVA